MSNARFPSVPLNFSASVRTVWAAALCAGLGAHAWAQGTHDHDHADASSAQHAHVHGVVTLDVAVDGEQLLLDLQSPLADIVGFEHAPKTAEQQQQAKDGLAKARNGAQWFTPTPAAQCVLESVELTAPTLEVAKDAHGHDHKDEHDHSHKDEHKHGKEGDGHDHDDHAHGHNDLLAHYSFRCARPDALQFVDVALFTAFPSIHTVDVQTALASGQTQQKLSPHSRRIELKR